MCSAPNQAWSVVTAAGPRAWIPRHPLLAFFILAYGLSWLGAIPYALGAWPVPLFPFGPLVAALIVTAVTGGWAGTRTLLLRMLQWRVGARWYAFALLLPVAVTAGAAYGNVLLGATDPTAAVAAALPSVVPLFALAMVFPLQGTMGEEPGWRGFAMPRLLSAHSPLATSLVLGVLWAGWHAPLFVTGVYGDAWLLRILSIVALAVLFTLLYLGTGGSVLLAMVFHTAWNLSAEILVSSFAGTDVARALTLYLVGGIAVAVVATIVAWPRLTHSSTSPAPPAPVSAPVVA
jgi:uncharacterized protein